MKNFIAIDVKTANFKPTSICSIGMVFVRNKTIVHKHREYIKPLPEIFVPSYTEFHGISYEHISHAPTFDLFWARIVPKLFGYSLVFYQGEWEFQCLKETLQAYQLPLFDNDCHSALAQVKKKLPQLDHHQLAHVIKYFGYELPNNQDSLSCALACAVVSMKLF